MRYYPMKNLLEIVQIIKAWALSRFGLVSGFGLLTCVCLFALSWRSSLFDPTSITRDNNATQGNTAQGLRVRSLDYKNDILQRSIFHPDRGPYARAVKKPKPAPTPVRRKVKIKLVGIVTVNGELTAMVLLDGQEQSVRLGDRTIAGLVYEIGSSWVVFEADGLRTIGLFD